MKRNRPHIANRESGTEDPTEAAKRLAALDGIPQLDLNEESRCLNLESVRNRFERANCGGVCEPGERSSAVRSACPVTPDVG